VTETIQIGELAIAVTRKAVKHVHLSVHPPEGHVTLVAPTATRLEVARAYAISKLGWIRDQHTRLQAQARETPRQFVERESHYLWGRQITLSVRPGTSQAKREEVMQGWYRFQLHAAVPPLVEKWEARLGVKVSAYFLQRMKTKWGGCTPSTRTIRLNTELAKKPKDLLEYIVVHEMAHMIEPTHSERFTALLDQHYPTWREARAELNELPLAAESWGAQAS